jgi:hypothetical protein
MRLAEKLDWKGLTGKNTVISTTHDVKQQTFMKKEGKTKKTNKRKRRYPVVSFDSSSTEANFGMNETLPTTWAQSQFVPTLPPYNP